MNLYNTTSLLGVIAGLERPSTFLLDLFFPDEMVFDTEEVYFDKIDDAMRLAPFVSPLVAGKAMRGQGYATRSLKPAYLKPKHVVEPAKAFKRAAGEGIGGGELSPEQRFDMAVTANMELEDNQITRREEWMASEILRTGSVTVEGEDFPTMLVDYGRHVDHEIALAGAARWGEAGVSPLATLKAAATTVATNSGAAARLVILDPLAAALLTADAELRAIMDNRRQSDGDLQLAPLISAADGEEAVKIGSIGQFEFWQYQSLYKDAAGAQLKMMPDHSFIMGSPRRAAGVRTYGAIQDKRAGLKAMSRFPKMWDVEDPSSTLTMTQSAPLPVLMRPDATFAGTVR